MCTDCSWMPCLVFPNAEGISINAKHKSFMIQLSSSPVQMKKDVSTPLWNYRTRGSSFLALTIANFILFLTSKKVLFLLTAITGEKKKKKSRLCWIHILSTNQVYKCRIHRGLMMWFWLASYLHRTLNQSVNHSFLLPTFMHLHSAKTLTCSFTFTFPLK